MEYKELAESIVRNIGGRENVESLTHCVTRLRFVLRDKSKADDEAVKKLSGVKGLAKQGGQYQVIIGPEVGKVAVLVNEALVVASTNRAATAVNQSDMPAQKKDTLFNRFFKVITGCIFPFMGMMITSGIIKGVLSFLVVLQLLMPTDGTYRILYAGADTIIYFLPVFIGFSAGKKFGANPFLTAVLGASLLYPDITKAFQEHTALTFLGIPVLIVNYANSLFPIILAVWAAAKIEAFWKKIIPEAVSSMFVPCFTLTLILPATVLVIGPVITFFSDLLAAATQFVWTSGPIIAGMLLGAFWQVIVLFGLHYAFIPILINNITTNGVDPINAVLGMTVMALVGAGIGYSLKQKNKENRAEGFTCSLTAFLGVTEPIIYSIALPKKKPFVSAFVGGAIAGGLMAASGAAMQGFGNGGVFQAFMMISPRNAMNIVWFGICSVIAVVVSGILSYIISECEETKKN